MTTSWSTAIPVPGLLTSLALIGCAIILGITLAWYRARSASRMLSTVSCGDAKITVKFGRHLAVLAIRRLRR